jgi:hypothetical protein
MKPKTVTLNKAAVLSNNSLKKGVVIDTSKVANYERRRKKVKKSKRRKAE